MSGCAWPQSYDAMIWPVSWTEEGSHSHRNLARFGFQTAYLDPVWPPAPGAGLTEMGFNLGRWRSSLGCRLFLLCDPPSTE